MGVKAALEELIKSTKIEMKKPEWLVTFLSGTAMQAWLTQDLLYKQEFDSDPAMHDPETLFMHFMIRTGITTLTTTIVHEQAYHLGSRMRNLDKPLFQNFIKSSAEGLAHSIHLFYLMHKGLFQHLGNPKSWDVISRNFHAYRVKYNYSEAQYLSPDSPIRTIQEAISLFHFGHFDESLLKLREFVDKYNQNQKFRELLDIQRSATRSPKKKGVIAKMIEQEMKYSNSAKYMQKMQSKSYTTFLYALNLLGAGRLDEMAAKMEESISMNQSKNPEMGITAGVLLHSLGYDDQGRDIMKKSVEAFIRQQPVLFSQGHYYIGSRRAWRTIDDYFGNALVMVKGDSIELQSEMQRISMVQQRIINDSRQDELWAITPIGIYDFKGGKSLALVHQIGTLQREAYGQSIEAQVAGFKAHGFLQAAMSQEPLLDNLGIHPYVQAVIDRLVKDPAIPIVRKPSLIQQICDDLPVCFSFYEDYPFLVWDADRNAGGAIMLKRLDKGFRTIMLDFERKGTHYTPGYNRPESDDAKNLFDGLYLQLHPKPEQFIYDQILMKNEEFNSHCKDRFQITNDTYSLSVMLTAIAKAISFASYSHTLENPRKEMLSMPLAAITAADIAMSTAGDKLTRADCQRITNLQDRLLEMNNYSREFIEKNKLQFASEIPQTPGR